jgi:hypothetical protein
MHEDGAGPFPGTNFAQWQHSLTGAIGKPFWDATDKAQARVTMRHDVAETHKTTEVLILATPGQVVAWRTSSEQQTPLLKGVGPVSNGCEISWQGARDGLPVREVLRDASLACRGDAQRIAAAAAPHSRRRLPV